jgi:hypothetical protein
VHIFYPDGDHMSDHQVWRAGDDRVEFEGVVDEHYAHRPFYENIEAIARRAAAMILARRAGRTT